jgi:CheY-specific phosphatase CheX
MTGHETLLQELTGEVLETMFFSIALGPSAGGVPERPLTAEVSFTGSRSGSLRVSTGGNTAAALADTFLGGAEEPDDQAPSVLGELANVLCGAILGRIAPSGSFTISIPQLSSGAETASTVADMQVSCGLELEEGELIAGLTIV